MIRRLLLVVASVLGVAVFLPATPAQASPVPPACPINSACLWQYWADATHTTLNGFRSVNCAGQVATGGRLIGWVQLQASACD